MKKTLLIFCMLFCFVNSSFSQNRGYEKSIETSNGIGLDKYTKYSSEIAMVYGYRLNDYFFAGIGAGIKYTKGLRYGLYTHADSYEDFDNKTLIPVYVRAKVNLTKSTISPFFSVDGGYTIDISKNDLKNEGLMIDPSLGIDFKLTEKQLMYFMVGVNIQNIKYNNYHISSGPTSISGSVEEEKKSTSTLNLKVGYRF